MKNSEFKKIGLVGKYGEQSATDTLERTYQFLHSNGYDVVIETDSATAAEFTDVPTASLDDLGKNSDLIISIGGDGTLLHVARAIVQYETALLGINLGRLGFLVDIPPSQLEATLAEVLVGEYQEEQRSMLKLQINNEHGEIRTGLAFNDVVVHKWEVARMIETETFINGRLLNRVRADGLIVSTPTGSTAYALSGGGPIIEPNVEALVLVPICPHSMSYRPIVINATSEITIIVNEATSSQAHVTCDGQTNIGLVSGDKISITTHPKKIRLIHPHEHDYFHVLRAKLHWGELF